ncbi:amphi-Trp domain-containing protein [Halovenus rubra]|uniref:Amphi-Trp domain-containing protein n=2 Tax=Halovenus rubra TaxID=869890 RepID=A0ACC7DWW7_9EURY|nr:amphi-Trp domain-containing protein [Halovenus rubra]
MANNSQEAKAESASTDDETEREGEKVMSRADGAEVLHEVADSVEAGKIEIDGEDGFTVAVPEQFELEVEYEETDDEAEFEVEIEWQIENGEPVSTDN